MSMNQGISTIDEPEFGYGQLLGILWRRAAWVGGAIAISLGAATVLTLREEPVYQSSMQLLVEPNYQQPVDITGQEALRALASAESYATQLNLMRSTTFVERTVEKLLAVAPEVCGELTIQPDCIDKFKDDLDLQIITESRIPTQIVDVRVMANDPVLVQTFLETLGGVYLEFNEQQREQRLEEGLALVNQQIEGAQADLSGSRQELKQFREAEDLINPEEQAIAISNSLRQIEETEIDLRNQYLDARAEYNALRQQLNTDPQIALISSRLSQSSRYQQLLNSLQDAELALAQRLALYAEADPGVEDLKSQRQQQVELLRAEVVRVLGDLPAELDLAENSLLQQGQLGAIDLNLVSDLVQAQIRSQRLAARRAGLAQAKQLLEEEFSEFPGLIAEYDRIQPEIGIQQQSLEQLLQIREELSNELAQGGFSWDIVEAPQLGRKISPQPRRNLLLGAVAGVFVGGALAFGREALDKVVRTSDELQKQVALPLLGVIPEMPKGLLDRFPVGADARLSSVDSFSLEQLQPFRDALDLTYQTIQLTTPQRLPSLMVTSARPGEGKTTLGIGLAMSASRSNQRVLLIDANLRHPSLHERLGLPNQQGLSACLQQLASGGRTWEVSDIAVTTVPLGGSQFDVLTAGAVPADPVSLLSSVMMQQLMAQAEARYDLVIVDAPAILGIADSLQLASLCKGVVMVSRLDQTTQADLTQATAVLGQVNTTGVVANGYRGNLDKDGPANRNGRVAAPSKGLVKAGIFR